MSKSIGIICRLRHAVCNNVLKMLYCTLILPYLSYCNLVWANTCQSHLKKLISLQNKIVRIIVGAAPRTHAEQYYYEMKLMTINDILLFQQGVFVYKTVNQIIPSCFRELFSLNKNFHNYSTRSSGCLHLASHRTMSYQYNIRYTGPKLWNSLPLQITSGPSVNVFESRLKKYLLPVHNKK